MRELAHNVACAVLSAVLALTILGASLYVASVTGPGFEDKDLGRLVQLVIVIAGGMLAGKMLALGARW